MKKRLLQSLLDTNAVVLVVVSKPYLCGLPADLFSMNTVMLEIGYDLPIPIPDITLTDVGFSATLSFRRRQPYNVFVPWDAIESMELRATPRRLRSGKLLPSYMRVVK